MNSKDNNSHIPAGLWALSGVQALMATAGAASNIYIVYFGDFESRFHKEPILTYVVRFYPTVLFLIAFAGLFFRKKWILYVFSALTVLRSYELVRDALSANARQASWTMFWLPKIIVIVLAGVTTLYAWKLVRKGTLS